MSTRTDGLLSLLICAVGLWLFFLYGHDSPSNDLRAMWLAGTFFGTGDIADIYAGSEGLFTMRPPEAWVAFERAAGNEGSVYPYIYPPIWAALVAPLTTWLSFDVIVLAATLANAAMLLLMLVLAYRAARPDLPLSVWLATGIAMLLTTVPGLIAIVENQPQILVSFLLVLTLERLSAGKETGAGAALALAAAIKLYPAIFAVTFLFLGARRAVASFVLMGGALGLASIALAGWPLHAAFLGELSAISQTVLLNSNAYNLGSLFVQLANPGAFALVESTAAAASSTPLGWYVAPRPVFLTWVFPALALAAVVGLSRASVGAAPQRKAALWAALLIVVSLLTPLSWSYHYLPALAFLPLWFARYGARAGLFLVLAVLLPVSKLLTVDADWLYDTLLSVGIASPLQFAGTLAMAAAAAIFVASAQQRR